MISRRTWSPRKGPLEELTAPSRTSRTSNKSGWQGIAHQGEDKSAAKQSFLAIMDDRPTPDEPPRKKAAPFAHFLTCRHSPTSQPLEERESSNRHRDCRATKVHLARIELAAFSVWGGATRPQVLLIYRGSWSKTPMRLGADGGKASQAIRPPSPKIHAWPGTSWRPSPREADVIATRTQVLLIHRCSWSKPAMPPEALTGEKPGQHGQDFGHSWYKIKPSVPLPQNTYVARIELPAQREADAIVIATR